MQRPFPRPPTDLRLLAGVVLAAALTLGPALTAAEPAADVAAPRTRNPVVVKQVSPVHPLELQQKMVNGNALVECLITDTGEVQDVKVVSATLPEFGQAAVDALLQWEFQPGEKGGRPVAMKLQIPFEFRLTAEQVIEARLKRTVFQEINDTIILAQELPSWPRPINFLLPRYPESLKGSGKYGKAVVTIIINKEGKVMNPKLVKATYPEFILPSLVTAAQLEFPPQIMANNERIFVSMDVQFDFAPSKENDKAKDKSKKK